jgi:hypothetical protein
MTLTRQEVGIALKRLRQQRREVVKVRALANHPDDLEQLNQIIEDTVYRKRSLGNSKEMSALSEVMPRANG